MKHAYFSIWFSGILAGVALLLGACQPDTPSQHHLEKTDLSASKETLMALPDNRKMLLSIAASPTLDAYPELYSYNKAYALTTKLLDQEPIRIRGFLQGVIDALVGRDRTVEKIKVLELQTHWHDKARRKELYQRSQENWQRILNLPNLQADLEGGYYYQVLQKGQGRRVGKDRFVKFYYRMYLPTGTPLFGYLSGAPLVVRAGDVPLLGGALAKMKVGGMWRILLPYPRAFGENGSSRVPPYAVVIAELQLIATVEKPEEHQSVYFPYMADLEENRLHGAPAKDLLKGFGALFGAPSR